ncbi:hypothetical protein [Chromobacterium phragmitis]|uniref:hypothetical protein n=1 Tax=Chromobacterium phragmitis TaxID=2202141 RepID=UPI0011AE8928|nr:hypothetical protein [Chromobacterium phragmitis]
MSQPDRYAFDKETIKLNAYRLLCLFYASKTIASLSDPNDRSDPASCLEAQFFQREITHALLNLAICIRTLDDQMKTLPLQDPRYIAYENICKDNHNKHWCTIFDDEKSLKNGQQHLPLREVCNKILHAAQIDAQRFQQTGGHAMDYYNMDDFSLQNRESSDANILGPTPILWTYLSGNIRLSGRNKGKSWVHLLVIPSFVDATYHLIDSLP